MPKRSSDMTANQERAYVAASRRSDRSIEARIQSAHMASEVHKKRTGKGLRISEAIVMRDEAYEEETDGLPRSYRVLGRHMQTSSPEMNSRVNAYITSQAAMSNYVSATEQDWRRNEVNQAFSQMFPEADKVLSRRWSTDLAMPPPAQSDPLQLSGASADPHTHAVDDRQGPDSSVSSYSEVSPPELGMSMSDQSLPPLTPESSSRPETPQSQVESGFGNEAPNNLFMGHALSGHAFAPELTLESKIMMMGETETFQPAFYPQQWIPNDAPLDPSYELSQPKRIKTGDKLDPYCGLSMDALDSMEQGLLSRPSYVADDFHWDELINDTAWMNDS